MSIAEVQPALGTNHNPPAHLVGGFVYGSLTAARKVVQAEHSDIKLTMGTYTDSKQLDVREAMERLPKFLAESHTETPTSKSKPPTTGDKVGQFGASADNRGFGLLEEAKEQEERKSLRNVNKKNR